MATSIGEAYCPEAGDLIWLDFDPAKGHEQAGHRPALVLTPRIYNKQTLLCIACPVTSKARAHATEVAVDGAISGVVLTNQVKCVSWSTRYSRFIGVAPAETITDVRERIAVLIGL